MHAWLITPYLVLSGILFLGLLQSAHAAPEVRVPAASKSKMVPRPVPGLGGHAHADHAPAAPFVPAPFPVQGASKASVAVSSGNPQARILMVFRRGTVNLPPDLAPPQPPAPKLSGGSPSAPPVIVPRPGEVRIITKAEAEALAAQPVLLNENK